MGKQDNHIRTTIAVEQFSMGMADAVDPGLASKGGYTMPAVRYMQNFNPNFIQGGLVKRLALENFWLFVPKHFVKDYGGVAGITDVLYANEKYLDIPYQEYMFPFKKHRGIYDWDSFDSYYLNIETGEFDIPYNANHVRYANQNIANLIIGMDRLDMARPFGSAYFIALRDDSFTGQQLSGITERTSINGFYPMVGLLDADNLQVVGWVNPLYGKTHDRLEFPHKGSILYGTVGDWVKMGQAVFFASMQRRDTTPYNHPHLEKIRPVYRWSMVDYDNIDMDPIFTQTRPLHTYFVVDYDSNILVGHTSLLLPRIGVPSVNALPGYLGNQTDTEPVDLPLLLGRKYEDNEYQGFRNKVEVVFWQSNALPKHTPDSPVNLFGVHSIPSGFENRVDWQRGIEMTGDQLEDPVKTVMVKKIGIPYNGKYYGVHGHPAELDPKLIHDDNVSLFTMFEPSDPLPGLGGSSSNDYVEFGTGITLRNYASSQMPRDWSPSEPIPYVLTAIINGAEILVHRSTFSMTEGIPLFDETDGAYNTEQEEYWLADDWADPEDFSYYASAINRKIVFPPYSLFTFTASPTMSRKRRWDLFGYLYFTLRIHADKTQNIFDILPPGLTSFRLYISQPEPGSQPYEIAPDLIPGMYQKPLVKTLEDASFGLVKEFPMKQVVQTYQPSEFATFGVGNQGEKLLEHGKWVYLEHAFVYPQTPGYPQHINNGGEGYYFIPADYNVAALEDLDFADNSGNYPWTPDFCLWDYAIGGASLAIGLGTLVTPWNGKGARCITSVGPFTLIGGTIDDKYKEEIGRIRRSGLQATVALTTEFAELDYIDVLNTKVIAVEYFRDSIWVFGEQSIGRISVGNPFDMDTWKVIDRIDGQGVMAAKHVMVTPDFLYFANQNGIWRTNGGDIENVAVAILGTYQRMYSGKTFYYELNKIATFQGSNPEDSELSYDIEHSELIFSKQCVKDAVPFENRGFREDGSPDRNITVSLVFNTLNNNWRVETFDNPEFKFMNANPKWIIPPNLTRTVGRYHKFRFTDYDGKHVTPIAYGNGRITWQKRTYARKDDQFIFYAVADKEVAAIKGGIAPAFPSSDVRFYNYPYSGILNLYDIGTGINDHQLRRVIVEVEGSAIVTQYGTGSLPVFEPESDPMLYVDMRNKTSYKYGDAQWVDLPALTEPGIYDLVELNMRGQSDVYYSHLNKPESQSWRSRESLVLNTPLQSKFRRCGLTWIAYDMGLLRSFEVTYSSFRRKKWA